MTSFRVQIGSWDKFNDYIGSTANNEKEKKFLRTGGHKDQSKVVQEVLMDLKMKKG